MTVGLLEFRGFLLLTLLAALAIRASDDSTYWSNAGAYAPWRSLGHGGGDGGVALPGGCSINQVNLLHRHGSRFPTASAAKRLKASLAKLESRNVTNPGPNTGFAFLPHADFNLTNWDFDNLNDAGRAASWRSGKHLKHSYSTFLRSSDGLYVRATNKTRVHETAAYWLSGYDGHHLKIVNYTTLPQPNLIIPESTSSNNTLAVNTCENYENQDDANLTTLVALLGPTASRINTILLPTTNLTTSDIVNLADMCPMDSQKNGTHFNGWSEWCGIFTAEEWNIVGYYRDVKRYYEVGQGSTYGRTIGAGYANELIARLTDSAVVDNTDTNRTLDSNEATFPRGGKHFFADFSHDNEIMAILSAINISQPDAPLTKTTVPAKRDWITPNIVEFGARVVFERVGCSGSKRNNSGSKNYVRVFINDKPYKFTTGACASSKHASKGLCEVDLFLQTQEWSRNDVNWEVCNA